MVETLPALRERFGGRVALAHFDAGTGDKAGNLALAAALTPSIIALLCRGGVLVSDPPIETANSNRCRCQTGFPPGGIIFIPPAPAAAGRHQSLRRRKFPASGNFW